METRGELEQSEVTISKDLLDQFDYCYQEFLSLKEAPTDMDNKAKQVLNNLIDEARAWRLTMRRGQKKLIHSASMVFNILCN